MPIFEQTLSSKELTPSESKKLTEIAKETDIKLEILSIPQQKKLAYFLPSFVKIILQGNISLETLLNLPQKILNDFSKYPLGYQRLLSGGFSFQQLIDMQHKHRILFLEYSFHSIELIRVGVSIDKLLQLEHCDLEFLMEKAYRCERIIRSMEEKSQPATDLHRIIEALYRDDVHKSRYKSAPKPLPSRSFIQELNFLISKVQKAIWSETKETPTAGSTSYPGRK